MTTHSHCAWTNEGGHVISGDNRWIKLADLIPWDELEDDYAAQFCKGFGAPAKPFRMALGALIIKARLGLTDEELVEHCQGRPLQGRFARLKNRQQKHGVQAGQPPGR